MRCVLIFIGIAGLATAQSNTASRESVMITLMDKHHKPWTAPVSKDKLEIIAGTESLPITDLEPEASRCKLFAVLVDESGSMLDKTRYMNEYALTAYKTFERQSGQGILGLFGDTVGLPNVLMSSSQVEQFLSRAAPQVGAHTALYDAIAESSSKLAALSVADSEMASCDREVLVISDGEDEGSKRTEEEAIQSALQNRVTISFVGLMSFQARGKWTIEKLTRNTGGFDILLTEPKKFAPQLEQFLTAQYRVTFLRPTHALPNKLTTLKMISEKELVVSFPTSYLPTPLQTP